MKNDFEGMVRLLKLQKTLGRLGLPVPNELREKLTKRHLNKYLSRNNAGNVWSVSWDNSEIMLRITIQSGFAFFPIEEHNRTPESKKIFLNRLQNMLSDFSKDSVFKIDGRTLMGPLELLKYIESK